MKTIRFSALLMLFGLLVMVSACKKETNPATAKQTGSKIMVTGQDAGTGLKSTLNGQTSVWIASTDQVGIYSPQARTVSGGNDPIVNAQFTAATSDASSAFSGTMYWGSGDSHTFYAYYPWASGTAASTVVPVSLATAQTQSAANNSDHIGTLDFMVATPATVTPSGPGLIGAEVHMSYNHLFTVLEFQITGSGTLNAVKLSSTRKTVAFSGGTIDLNQTPTAAPYTFATQTGSTTQTVVTLTTPATITSTVQKVYMVINPSTASETCYIGLLSGSTWTYITKAAPDGGFLRGKKYEVAVTSPGTAGPAPSGAIDPAIDVDGNTYNTATIGTQTWMKENLKTTKYNDGTAIPNITGFTAWETLTTGAYCWFNSGSEVSPVYVNTYGALYNWSAADNNASTKVASNGGKNICPVGWHVPTNAEWSTLTNYVTANLGISVNAAKALAATSDWTTNTTSGNVGNDQPTNNSSSFTALPGGWRQLDGTFPIGIGKFGSWWSSNVYSIPDYAYSRDLLYTRSTVSTSTYNKKCGMSVRCLRD